MDENWPVFKRLKSNLKFVSFQVLINMNFKLATCCFFLVTPPRALSYLLQCIVQVSGVRFLLRDPQGEDYGRSYSLHLPDS